jgi:ligand-binding SRPBCC domain-containing protein
MGTHVFRRQQLIDRPIEDVFDFFASAVNLQEVTPDALDFKFLDPPPEGLQIGTRVRYRLRISGIPVTWVTRITEWDPPHGFADLQEQGPYRLWRHRHSFREIDRVRTLMTDEVEYKVPLGFLGELVRVLYVDAQLKQVFDFRERAFAALLEGAEKPRLGPLELGRGLARPVGALGALAGAGLLLRAWRRR